jgi:arabinan endo-1,5-alpha-L-arabinosidase
MKKRIISLALCLMLAAMFALPAMAEVPSGGKHWSFDGDLGDATIATGITPMGSVSFAEGKRGQALVLDGGVGLDLGRDIIKSDTYTVAMWVNVAEYSTWSTMFFGAADLDNWVSFIYSGPDSNFWGVWSRYPWSDNFDVRGPLPRNEWVHVAFVAEGEKVTLYRNGSAVATNHGGGGDADPLRTVLTGGGEFYLGVNFWDAPFKGMIDELYVYNNRALTRAQIRTLMDPDATDGGGSNNAGKTGDATMLALALIALMAAAGATVIIARKVKA